MAGLFDFLFCNDIGIDLGTATTLVYVKGQGIVLSEPSVVAVNETTGELVAVGEEAKRMLGKTPTNIISIRPMRDGVIADFDITQRMIRYFIRKVHRHKTLLHPRMVIGIPSGITEVEKRAVREAALQAGAREVFLIQEPMAAAIGSGVPVADPGGNMVVDVGGGTTEVAVVSLGGIVISKSIRTAGDEMDQAIEVYCKKKYNLLIGEHTAEDVKIRIGTVLADTDDQHVTVKGRDVTSGLPRTVEITSRDIAQAISEAVQAIIEVIKECLEDTPPELSADLIDRGIVLAGGGSLIGGLDVLMSHEMGIPVAYTDDPITCVVRGCGKYLEELDRIKKSKRELL